MASLMFVGLLVLGSTALAVLGVPACSTLALFWILRPPFLRDPVPPMPLNMFQRLPTYGDRIS